MKTLQERVHSAPKPDSWKLDKLRRVLRVRQGFKNVGMVEDNLLSLSYGRIKRKDIDGAGGLLPESFETYQIVEPGNIVMRLTDLQNDKRSIRQGLVTERGIITSAYDALEATKGNEARFWAYALLALDLAKYYYSLGGGVRQSIKFSDFPNDWVYLPDLATQKQIADFLDAETARIDALIEKKQRLIAVANERMAAIVETAIPCDGPQTKLGHHIDILSGYAFASEGFSSDPEDMRLLRGANVTPNAIRWDDVVYWPRDDIARLARFELTVGDIVLGMDRPWVADGIRVAELREQDTPALLLQRVCKISPRSSLNAGYLKLLLTSRRFLAYFEPIMTGVSVPHISPDQVRNFRFGYVPLDEQVRISNLIELARKQVSKVVELAEASIDRLREYRAALITAAVTGQIEVAAHARPVEMAPPRVSAEVLPLRPVAMPDRRGLRVLVAADVVHRLGADPYLGRTKLQKLMFLAEAHANINDIAGCYQRYRYGPYDDAMVQEIELGLRQDGYYDTREGTGVDREKVAFKQMSRAGGHRDALAAALGGKTDSLRQLVDLFKGKDTAATEAVATLYAVWNDALIDGKQPDDAAIIRGFLQDWHPEKGKFKQADLQTWLGWMRRHGLVPKGNGPRTVSTNTPSLFERE